MLPRMELKLRRTPHKIRSYTNITPTSNPAIPNKILFVLIGVSEDAPQDRLSKKPVWFLLTLGQKTQVYRYLGVGGSKQFSGQLPLFKAGLT